jgi:hypothetical protein
VRKLRLLASSRSDPLSLRLQLESALADESFHPASISAGAILCVRRLPQLTLPHRLLRMESRRQLDLWRARIKDVLDICAKGATRPASGAIASESEAVLFGDFAELLACFARDWLRGEAAGHWWWQALFPGRTLAEAVRQAWTNEPEHVPAALSRLHRTDLSGAFLRALPAPTVAAININVARIFAVQQLREEITRAVVQDGARSLDANMEPHRLVAPSHQNGDPILAARTTPWAKWVHTDPDLSSESQTLLVLSILLIKAPVVARSLKFIERVRHYVERRESLTDEHSPLARQTNGRSASSPARNQADTLAIVGRTRLQPPDSGVRQEVMPLRIDQPLAVRSEIQFKSMIPVHVPDPLLGRVCFTAWGGVFYLINLAVALGLYGDFTQPCHPSLPLPVWDFLALIGGRLIGPRFEKDDLWSLFAKLSGRAETEPPGAWFDPPDELLSGREAATSACDEAERSTLAATRLDRWLNRMATIITKRLVYSLKEGNPEAVTELVFHHAAQVLVTSERVTVCFSLAAHPIELRIAGLDRDPGWVPAAGREIFFQYD